MWCDSRRLIIKKEHLCLWLSWRNPQNSAAPTWLEFVRKYQQHSELQRKHKNPTYATYKILDCETWSADLLTALNSADSISTLSSVTIPEDQTRTHWTICRSNFTVRASWATLSTGLIWFTINVIWSYCNSNFIQGGLSSNGSFRWLLAHWCVTYYYFLVVPVLFLHPNH